MKPNTKPKLLILEGADKTGKSTIYQAYRRATDYGPLVIDRFIGSNLVHDEFYQRSRDNTNLILAEKELMSIFDIYLCVLVADEVDLLDRIRTQESGEDRDRALDNFRGLDKLYRGYAKSTSIPRSKVRVINTSAFTMSSIISYLKKFTEEE